MDIDAFMNIVWDNYESNKRNMPWRTAKLDGMFDPYCIMVSEIMLQQTQVSRVIEKYQKFLDQFPSVQKLADAPLSDVIRIWQGLGYNRRAKFLHLAAQKVVSEFGSKFPTDKAQLSTLPGIGANTAGAIMAYAYNEPVVYIETNIRTVFIHHFFEDHDTISDSQLLPLLQQCIDKLEGHSGKYSFREWYWALMDYGAYLKQQVGNKSRKSKAYTKQSKFEGSRRQVRGAVLRLLTQDEMKLGALRRNIADDRLLSVLIDLTQEGMIKQVDNHYSLS
ncbi:MAG: A/G-specific adenine glycosylase [Candidatus Saccharibacteria bacterium]|nr:A/G-specific adenine glycosylase [Candidatus Saccharibacteria bacterium]